MKSYCNLTYPRFFVILQTGLLLLIWAGSASLVWAEDFWAVDPASGCQVWSDTPVDDASVTWSGNCLDEKAHGEGELEISRQGERIAWFSGAMIAGKANGNGVFEVINEQGTDRYTGSFQNGLIHGFGIYEGADGSRYEGQFADDLPHGFGQLDDGQGMTYIGEIVMGEASGYGSETRSDGERYDGQFLAGDRSGLGTMQYANGDLYFGQFVNNKPEGTGRLDTKDSGVYQGSFHDGLAEGYGTYVAADEVAYQGRFVAGKADGVFLVTQLDGSTGLQTWKNDERVD